MRVGIVNSSDAATTTNGVAVPAATATFEEKSEHFGTIRLAFFYYDAPYISKHEVQHASSFKGLSKEVHPTTHGDKTACSWCLRGIN